jgi:biotin carboxylase
VPRIWFNRSYATTYHLIAQLRANPAHRALHVIGTHTDPTSPVLAGCDETAPESATTGSAYVEWALEFARTHAVDVLVPREHAAELADARAEFAALGTCLMSPGAATIRLFADKVAGYAAAAALGLAVPPARVVTDGAGLRAAYAEFAGPLGAQVCMKPVEGVGGLGYRRLIARPSVLSDFAGELRSAVQVEEVARALDDAYAAGRPGPRLMVMPFLDGTEVSVDVLARPDGEVLAAIGRAHHGTPETGRSRRVVDDVHARTVAETLTRAHRVAYLSNTQIRYWQGPADPAPRPYLLELNTRAAGGLFQTRLAGVNLAWAALQLALGEEPDPITPTFGASYTRLDDIVRLPSSR